MEPHAITVDNGSECASRVMDAWAYRPGMQLDCMRPGKPVENGFIERFNGRLRDACLNVEVCFTLKDVREKLARWQEDDTRVRPHSALQDQAPASFAAQWAGTVQTLHPSPGIVGDTHMRDVRSASSLRRLKPITRRPILQVSSGLHSGGGSFRPDPNRQGGLV